MTVIRRKEGYPTPTAKDANGPWHTSHSPSLNVVIRKWPTPCAQGDTHYRLKGDSQESKCQAIAVRGAKYDTPTVHGDGGSGRNGAMPKYGQLNPDWVEWLMFWLIGWTDLKKNNDELYWLDPSIDPASHDGQTVFDLSIPRVTNRRDNRCARIKELGNGQFPLSAVMGFDWGLCILEAVT